MGRKHLELEVVRVMVIADEEYPGTLCLLPLQKALDAGDDPACLNSNIQGIAFFQETPEHIDYQNRISHSFPFSAKAYKSVKLTMTNMFI